jgi:hypothetical protein
MIEEKDSFIDNSNKPSSFLQRTERIVENPFGSD